MRILVIEDDYKIANAIKKGLEQESYAVDASYDGKEKLGSILLNKYDLVILDRMLPSTDGIRICRMLRREKNHIPILILTAKDKLQDKIEGLNAGADDYLVKPFAFEELLARVRALLRRPEKTLDDILKVGDLELNRVKFTVKRRGKSVDLSSKEFALLEYFMRNPGRILTKDNIIAHVWDYDADILPNTVEVYIGYLRQKLEKPFSGSQPLFKTLRGFGYKLEDPESPENL
ncbi:DNA-binding response regulator [Candidatus Parcubacteria bacterium]|jgi:DNA-binding response OmpR family regulator|nr:MAG: DNA-binding response regulator [Candidatus Parcubacteria bacterium]